MTNIANELKSQTSLPEPPRRARTLRRVIREELDGLHLRLLVARLLLAPLPIFVGSRLRALVMRLLGFDIGRGTLMWGLPTINGTGNIYQKLRVGEACHFNVGCFLELGAEIVIEDRVAFGPQVMILTTTHEIETGVRRAGAPRKRGVRIGEGAWIGARCTILPGVTIGPGAVVGAGSLVNKDVAPNTLVAGVPARLLRELH